MLHNVRAMSFSEYSYESEFESYESSFVSHTHRQAKNRPCTDAVRLQTITAFSHAACRVISAGSAFLLPAI